MKKPITTKGAPTPSAPLSQAVEEDGWIYVSGQGPIDPATGQYTKSDISTETRQVFENIKAILEAANSSLDRVVKVNVYLSDMKDFAAMNAVYGTYFSTPYPARTTLQAAALPRGFGVEIDCVAHRQVGSRQSWPGAKRAASASL